MHGDMKVKCDVDTLII